MYAGHGLLTHPLLPKITCRCLHVVSLKANRSQSIKPLFFYETFPIASDFHLHFLKHRWLISTSPSHFFIQFLASFLRSKALICKSKSDHLQWDILKSGIFYFIPSPNGFTRHQKQTNKPDARMSTRRDSSKIKVQPDNNDINYKQYYINTLCWHFFPSFTNKTSELYSITVKQLLHFILFSTSKHFRISSKRIVWLKGCFLCSWHF